MQFKAAVRRQKKLKACLVGPTNAGKTRTALRIAAGMGGRIALIDSEHGSASMYADLIAFDHLELTSFAPDRYIEAIDVAEAGGYDVLIIDSLSHAWAGKDGVLELVDKKRADSRAQNGYVAWGAGTAAQNKLVERILACRLHLIVTLRSKMEYVQEPDNKGKIQIRKIGLQPVQRDGIEFEFDLICDLDEHHVMRVTKTRIDEFDGVVLDKAGEDFGKKLRAWLDGGAPVSVEPPKLAAAPSMPPKADERKAKALKWIEGHLARMSEFVKESIEPGSDEQQGTREALKTLLENEAKQLAALEAVDAGYFLAVRALDSDTECRVNGLTYDANADEQKAIGELMADFARAAPVAA